jgi:hypothetical protein
MYLIYLHLPSLKLGEVSEWLKEHAWKVCIPQKGIEGSNPSLSAFFIINPSDLFKFHKRIKSGLSTLISY